MTVECSTLVMGAALLLLITMKAAEVGRWPRATISEMLGYDNGHAGNR